MDGWIIGLLAGGALLLVLVLLLVVVMKAAATTAETAQAVLVALEDVKASTAPMNNAVNNLGQFDPETQFPPETQSPPETPGAGVNMEQQNGKEG